MNRHNRQSPWQAMYAALVEGTGSAVFICDAAGQVIDASPHLCDLLGETQAKVLQCNISDLFSFEGLPGDLLHASNTRGQTTVRLRASGGRLYGLDLNLRRLPDGCLMGMIDEKTVLQVSQAAQACVDNAPIAIFRIGLNAAILEANQQACLNLGYTLQELVGMSIYDIDPTYTPEIWREHHQNSALLSDRTFESIQKRKDGSTFPVEIKVKRYPFQGEVQSYSFVQDITQRRAAQMAITESEQLLRKSQSVGQIGSYYYDIITGLWFSTPAMDELFGIDETYLKNTNGWLALVYPDDREKMRQYLVRHVLTEHQRFDKEYRILRPSDKQARWVIGRGELEFDQEGLPIKLIGTIQDITARKLAELSLRASERKFRALTEQMPDFIWQKDLKSIYTFCNQEVANAVNKSVEAVIGCQDEDLYSPELAAQYRADDQQVITTGQPLITEEKWQYQGSERWLQTTKVPLLDEYGRCTGTIGVGRDITARREAEAQVRQLNEELERRVVNRTALLQTANADLEAFAYSVSHDLRAPLRAINGYTQILIEDHGSDLNKEGRRVCDVINKESQRMGQLIDDLLTFSRLGRADMQVIPADMQALVKTVFDELVTPYEKEHTRFELDPLPQVAADPILIRQVWVNLLSNALKFSRNREPAVIRVGCTPAAPGEHEITFWIKDNGAGFDMRYADKLFGVFQRLHTEKEFQGTGVGLAIVQRVVIRHGGRVWAQSEIGQGAEFFFTLPLKGEE